jgi:hypothetical protein
VNERRRQKRTRYGFSVASDGISPRFTRRTARAAANHLAADALRLLRPLPKHEGGAVGELAEAPEAWAWAMSLPERLGVRGPVDLLPAPYLRAPTAFRALPGAFRVGLVWAGSPEHSNDPWRSTRLTQWAPVLDVPGVTFYSLQVGQAAVQLREEPRGTVHDLAPELADWAQTAAAMAALDLVIGVDCGPINFAGALGVPLWVCLAANCDYRWGLEGDHTPWYARARLFRQPTAGDWGSVFAEVSTSLREMAERRAVEAS